MMNADKLVEFTRENPGAIDNIIRALTEVQTLSKVSSIFKRDMLSFGMSKKNKAEIDLALTKLEVAEKTVAAEKEITPLFEEVNKIFKKVFQTVEKELKTETEEIKVSLNKTKGFLERVKINKDKLNNLPTKEHVEKSKVGILNILKSQKTILSKINQRLESIMLQKKILEIRTLFSSAKDLGQEVKKQAGSLNEKAIIKDSKQVKALETEATKLLDEAKKLQKKIQKEIDGLGLNSLQNPKSSEVEEIKKNIQLLQLLLKESSEKYKEAHEKYKEAHEKYKEAQLLEKTLGELKSTVGPQEIPPALKMFRYFLKNDSEFVKKRISERTSESLKEKEKALLEAFKTDEDLYEQLQPGLLARVTRRRNKGIDQVKLDKILAQQSTNNNSEEFLNLIAKAILRSRKGYNAVRDKGPYFDEESSIQYTAQLNDDLKTKLVDYLVELYNEK